MKPQQILPIYEEFDISSIPVGYVSLDKNLNKKFYKFVLMPAYNNKTKEVLHYGLIDRSKINRNTK